MAARPTIVVDIPEIKLAFVGGPMAGVHLDANEDEELVTAIVEKHAAGWDGPSGTYVVDPSLRGSMLSGIKVFASWQPES